MNKYDLIDLASSWIAGILMMVVVCIIVRDVQYKKGQINALNGQVEYELVTQSDSTRTWELIKPIKRNQRQKP